MMKKSARAQTPVNREFHHSTGAPPSGSVSLYVRTTITAGYALMLTLWSFVKWLHVVGAMAWLGGVFFVVFMLRPTLAELPDMHVRRSILAGTVKRMRRIMNPVITLQVLTGAYMAWMRLGALEGLFAAPWSVLLVVKIALALLLISLYVVVPRLLLSGPAPARGEGKCCTPDHGPTPQQKLGHMLHMVLLLLGAVVILLAKMIA